MAQGTVHGHKDLRVWKESMRLAGDVYRITRSLPEDERFCLTAQMRRAAASIAANIAEGAGRGSDVDFARCVVIARGSLSELETHLLLCEDLGFLAHDETMHERIRLVCAMLTRLNSALRSRRTQTRPD
jgi:four helix bundle protein